LNFKLLILFVVSLLILSCLDIADEPWTETFLSTIDADGDNLHHLVKDVFGVPKFSHDGEKIIIANSQGFWTVNSDGTDYKCILDTLIVYNNYYSISPEEDNLIFSNSGNIYKVNYITNLIEKVFAYEEEGAWLYSYSPDGSKILFSTSEPQGDSTVVRLYTMNEDGTNQELLYTHTSLSSSNIRYPIYSQDMEKIFFVYGGLVICNSDGTDIELIVSSNLSYSPISTANEYVIFADYYDIFAYNYFTGVMLNLGNGKTPYISPNGTKVTFYDDDLYVMDIDGTNRTKIANTSNDYPSFSFDGEQIVFFGEINHSSKRKSNPLN